MELIRLFHSNVDIKPKVLLSHFLRYLGFYVEEIAEGTEPSKVDSIADIYILSKAYVKEHQTTIDVALGRKTILICKDGLEIDDKSVFSLKHDDKKTDKTLLNEVVSCLSDIIEEMYFGSEGLLVNSAKDIKRVFTAVANAYTGNNILQTSIYVRCFYKNPTLLEIGLAQYKGFYNSLTAPGLSGIGGYLLDYARSYAQFEVDVICRKNSCKAIYPVPELIATCLKLLQKYPDNEQVRILLADVYLELEDTWAKAGNEYGDIHLAHCAYANYKRGRILRKYAEDYDSAEEIQRWALKRKEDYYPSWYQIAMCQKTKGGYHNAVVFFGRVCEILGRKYQKHILSPIELEYLYKSVFEIVQINRLFLKDLISADKYEGMLADLEEEANQTAYLEEIGAGFFDGKQALVELICNVIRREIQDPCDETITSDKERGVQWQMMRI